MRISKSQVIVTDQIRVSFKHLLKHYYDSHLWDKIGSLDHEWRRSGATYSQPEIERCSMETATDEIKPSPSCHARAFDQGNRDRWSVS